MSAQLDQVLHEIAYHRPKDSETMERMEKIRDAAAEFAKAIDEATSQTPDMGKERAMSFRAISDATMYAIAGLARYEPDSYAGPEHHDGL